MPCFGSAVLEVLVGLVHLSFPPALAADEFHLQVEGTSPSCYSSQPAHPSPSHRAHAATPEAFPSHSSAPTTHSHHCPCGQAAAWMRDMDGLKDREKRQVNGQLSTTISINKNI